MAMIGDGWNGETPPLRPSARPSNGPRRVAVVTGSRAEFGLLKPVMLEVAARPDLTLMVIAAGSHLVAPAHTFHDVKASFNIAESVPMQIAGRTGRLEDVEATARGVARFARAFERLSPDWVVVLGDRIEAFAAGIAACVGGWALAHIHGGDRAEGIADESMRHALTKMAHLHLAATPASAERIARMGEPRSRIHVVGSPGIDALASIDPLDDPAFEELGRPDALLLMHPVGRTSEAEEAAAAAVIEGLEGRRILALHPNYDAGREGILRALEHAAAEGRLRLASHLPRERFVGLLKRLASSGGVMAGNSSAALIEAAALGLPALDVGSRQNGRERCSNVVHVAGEYPADVAQALRQAATLDLSARVHPYGAGDAGIRIASLLASIDPSEPGFQRKRCAY
jgi:UDP-hydrolysing UDP-N-acetyl-D-glucosamine 2-epimerase